MQRILTIKTPEHIGERVKVCGWVNSRRDHGKLVFIDLRDRSGLVQIVFISKNDGGLDTAKLYKEAQKLRPEWVISIEGEVRQRPEKMINTEVETGKIEILAERLEILNESKTPPFEISEDSRKINEENRLRYRYLDLRTERMRKNLILRHKVIKFIRDFMDKKGFIEIETPILTKSTPEGARDFVVPSRLHPGKFYALPQSPQQYKQLLMVAGLERYFQIARCFRDEDTRGDRQPEFTQLDLEMSFANQEEILELTEKLYIGIVKNIFPEKKFNYPFPRLIYQNIMERYSNENPDLRQDKNNSNELAFCFIINRPMFEWKETEKRWDAMHHPFTKIRNDQNLPEKEFIEHIKQNPEKLIAHQYDFVLNGYEIGGGSIREHSPKVLEAVFEIMGNKKEDIREKFGHLLEAFEYGVPPHGGIALGIDRLLMLLSNEDSIREIIAFPKTGDGRDLMMDSPSEINKEQMKELGIKVIHNS